jgi:hypothetical protein
MGAGGSSGGGVGGVTGAGGATSGAGGAVATDAGVDVRLDAATDRASTPDAATDVGIACGTNVCSGGTYCCNASCGTCVPGGTLCPQIACGCVADPTGDSACGGTRPPHAYRCVLAVPPPTCVVLNIGNVTDTYCCP